MKPTRPISLSSNLFIAINVIFGDLCGKALEHSAGGRVQCRKGKGDNPRPVCFGMTISAAEAFKQANLTNL